MSELQLIESTLRQASRRRRLHRALLGLWWGLLIGACAWLLALGIYKLLPIPQATMIIAGLAAAGAVLTGAVIGAWRSDGLLQTARWVDQRRDLKERLSTALEVSRDSKAGPWIGLVVGDAARHVGEVDVRSLVPYRLPSVSRWVLLALAVSAGLGFVPEYRSEALQQKQREKDAIREAGRQLAGLAKRSLEKRNPVQPVTKEALKSVGELGAQLAKSPPPRQEALRDLAKMTDQLQKDTRELARQPGLRAMERNARSSGRNTPADPDELQKKLDALQKALGGKEGQSDALEKLQDALEKTQRAAANLMSQTGEAAASAKNSLSSALSELAKQAEDLGAVLPSLDEAIAALEAGKIDQVLKDLKIAEKDLDKIREMAQALQQLQQQAGKMGKNLKEQLEKGQVEAARSTLLKMISALKSPSITLEQLRQMMEEVAKAADPGAEYGKVGDLLKKAANQMNRGDTAGAAQSLDEAVKELESLMQQLGDLQDLKGMMDALKRAQMCVGNCSGWGLAKGPPKGGKGGKPGRGVGTWADEDGWTDIPEETEKWDNSGIERPDTDARGITDRGEPELPEGMKPTKVKGQLSPGGPMPSISLKGVSIKGTSTVLTQEASASAQSDDQSAVSHDQVPRAYQGTVKDYFDDINLKKQDKSEKTP